MEDDMLPVTVAKNETVAAAPPFSAAVQLVSEWALLTAFSIAFAPALVVYILYYFHVHCTPVIKQPTVLYSAFALFVSIGVHWCSCSCSPPLFCAAST